MILRTGNLKTDCHGPVHKIFLKHHQKVTVISRVGYPLVMQGSLEGSAASSVAS